VAAPADLELLHCSFVQCLRAENRSAGTIYVYGLAIRQLAEFLDGLADSPSTADIECQHIEAFIGALADAGVSGATLNNRYRSLPWPECLIYQEHRGRQGAAVHRSLAISTIVVYNCKCRRTCACMHMVVSRPPPVRRGLARQSWCQPGPRSPDLSGGGDAAHLQWDTSRLAAGNRLA
jgi:hypothetical protein